MFSVESFRRHFPLLQQQVHQCPLIYFDNAATSQKPQSVIDAITKLYTEFNSNVHRGGHSLANQATSAYESARSRIKGFINASNELEIIWTSGTTAGVNMLAQGLSSQISVGDEIAVSAMEHHANLVPWQQLAQRTGAKLVILPIDKNGGLNESDWKRLIGSNTKIVATTYASNVTGAINAVSDIIKHAKSFSAITVVDAAQAIAHLAIDVQELDCDFLLFSGHKVFAPTGIGVLYGKEAMLEQLPPYQFGGEMVSQVSYQESNFAPLPSRLEAGTPNYEGAIGLAAALDFLAEFSQPQMLQYEQQLFEQLKVGLSDIKGVRFLPQSDNSIALLSFNVDGIHPNDLAVALDHYGVAVRAGFHCAIPFLRELGAGDRGCIRVSLCAYNTTQEVEYFISYLKQAIELINGDVNPEQFKAQIELSIEQIEQKFLKNKSWDYQYREILRLGKQLNSMPEKLKLDENLQRACESKVWMSIEKGENQLYLQADSDAKAVRGLIAILMVYVNQLTLSQLAEFDFHQKFAELGFIRHLSPSRGNGFNALIKAIEEVIAEEIKSSV